ncbi:Hypothetical predicted protein [Mytilus galloprovincialis]|uniref:Insulin-degrading enzyme n=1 Tax=Mytilus galloprovincialis TaxID=29158 RepID=A0A8B6BTD0_MYTGA|nr:Hypothetical predicted protein [Mytilus galloprovincialis]
MEILGSSFVYHEKNHVHKSSSIEVYYQCGLQQTQPNMLLEMFVQIIAEPCFDILRTKEQLGYIVFSGVRRSNGVQGLRVIIQSDRSPEYVEKRVEAFLNSMDDYIKEMTDEAFQKHLKALVSKRMEKPKKISGQNSRYWSEILSQQYNFDRETVEVEFLKTVKKEDVFSFFKDLSAMTIRFKGKEKPRNYTTQVAGLIHKYNLSEVLSGPYLMSEFQPDLITMVLDKLQPDRMRIFVVSKKFEDKTNIKEKWYGTDNSVEDIKNSKIQMWSKCGENENLTLPEKNDFIPTDFELVTREVDPASLPELIKDSAMTQL